MKRFKKLLVCFNGYQTPYGQHRTGIPREQSRKDTEAWRQKRFGEFRQRMDCNGLTTECACHSCHE